MKNILVPTDFSELAYDALSVAGYLAGPSQAHVYLLNVIEPVGAAVGSGIGGAHDDGMHQVYMIKLIEQTQRDLVELAEDPRFANIYLTPKVLMGRVFERIDRMVEDHQMDLVVMGTAGLSGFDELMLGSTTEKVVRRVNCPVLAVHDLGDADFKLESVVLATDGHEDATRLVAVVKQLQAQFHFHIHLLTVITPLHFLSTKVGEEHLKAFVEQHQLENTTLHLYSDVSEEKGILSFAREVEADLIALVTHHRRGLMHFFRGSLGEDIVNHAIRPVLTVRI
ncbi:Nucleotide-binding universal stress protein, UspA family [Catalinimonas alkaloidigena]|uniref:Nucleotide-binding universal stress protein, UspA family n=1 Tax=Catalinimonas alkaloidigena TaxID=1075417 RepID=A0A1G9VRA7_9BACT|nr:universal stress protein [Catalinimonas alkaloidigena]SDM74680.1 Nucleotide-binding universal stress protein, UspA family [Catalinimonas alkaloidigena]